MLKGQKISSKNKRWYLFCLTNPTKCDRLNKSRSIDLKGGVLLNQKTANKQKIFTAAIVEVHKEDVSEAEETLFFDAICSVTEKIGYSLVKILKITENPDTVRNSTAKLVDEDHIDLIFVRNRGRYSINEVLFDLEDRSFRDQEDWKRMWSRQRILYSTFNHAVTVVRDHTWILNFEGTFTTIGEELTDILKSWKETYIQHEFIEKN